MNMENVNSMFASGMESVAQMSLGQAVLRLVDRILYVIEKSIQWSLPEQEVTSDENGKAFGKVELVRPLPWIFFLPTLIALRIYRFGVNVAASVLGFPQIEPSEMVNFVQRGRRRLRAIKSSGLKNIRLKKMPTVKDRAMSMKEATKSLAKSIRLTLSTLSCLDSGSKTSPSPPPTKIRVSSILDGAPTGDKPWQGKSPMADTKRKYSELSSDDESEDEPLLSKIDRLANIEDDSDTDFSPSNTSSDSSEISQGSDLAEDISQTEIQDITFDRDEWKKAVQNSTNKNTQSTEIVHVKTPDKKANEDTVEKFDQEIVENKFEDNERDPIFCNGPISMTNGINTDVDVAYYSPISWKSVSPEPLTVPEKDDTSVDDEIKSEEIPNGELNNDDKEINEDDNSKPNVEDEDVVNGHMKDKPKVSSSNGNNKSYKNKRGTHGNRKKK